MAIPQYAVGLLFSLTGPYSVVARSMMNGALLALEEINAFADLHIALKAVPMDPAGDNAQYAAMADKLLARGIKHVVGCYTSSSRKEVIPCFEKHDALLWYPSHYEGFESSGNVVYTGAAPNQHIIPLIDYLTAHHGRPRLLHRLQLHLGLGKQPHPARNSAGATAARLSRNATFPSARPISPP